MDDAPVVLFMCTHNAGRSQMAAALLAREAAGRVRVTSAGSEPASAVNPAVVAAMAEIGIDISARLPKPLAPGQAEAADVVVTMGCGDPRPVRRAGRVIALDSENRVLLLQHDSRHYGLHWATPGGGLEDGEDFPAGAARELREETGWQDVAIEPAVVLEDARAQGPESRFSKTVHRFFLARLPVPRRPVADVDGMHASDGILDHRWWTLAELESTTETIWPPGLLPVLRRLIG